VTNKSKMHWIVQAQAIMDKIRRCLGPRDALQYLSSPVTSTVGITHVVIRKTVYDLDSQGVQYIPIV